MIDRESRKALPFFISHIAYHTGIPHTGIVIIYKASDTRVVVHCIHCQSGNPIGPSGQPVYSKPEWITTIYISIMVI